MCAQVRVTLRLIVRISAGSAAGRLAHSAQVALTVEAREARGGNLAIWHLCEGGAYNAATKGMTSGCGGGSAGPLLTATMERVAVGVSALVAGAVWPQALAPGQSASLFVGVNGLTEQGVYTLRFTITVAGAAPINVAPGDGAFLEAPNARVWTGTACTSAAMLAKIPSATQDAWYVCPPTA